MKKQFIKFTLSSRKTFTFPIDVAEEIINSPIQLIKINDKGGNWTGEVINKAHIVSSERDFDEEEIYRRNNPISVVGKLLKEENELTEEEKKKNRELYEDMMKKARNLGRKKAWGNPQE